MKAKTIEMVLGVQQGCIFDDILCIPLSPSETEDIKLEFEQLALRARDYGRQGRYRKIADKFGSAHREWERARDEKNKREHDKSND